MEISEGLDLDSLLDLIDEDDLEKESNLSTDAQKSLQSTKQSDDCNSKSVVEPSVSDVKNSAPDDLTADDPFPILFSAKISNDVPSSKTAAIKASLIHTGDTSEEDEEEIDWLSETGKLIKKKITPISDCRDKAPKSNVSTWKQKMSTNGDVKESGQSLDKMLGVRVTNPVVSCDVMEKRLQGRKLIKMSYMKNYVKKGDIEGDWVTVGVVVKKIPPRTSKTGKLYSIWNLTDLLDIDKITSLFLFGDVHKEHWKLSVGTVIGLLNPNFMDSSKEEYVTIKVDHPGKVMLIGTSKDFGHCKSKRKDGTPCTSLVNLSQCQYCSYHVKNEYKKFSKRSDIQTSWSGRAPSLKEKVLKGQNMFYAGQSLFALGKQEKKANSFTTKDKLTLSKLTLKRKAEAVFKEENTSVKKIAEVFGNDISKIAEKNSEFINNRLMTPSPGSRNFLRYMIKNKEAKDGKVNMESPGELLKQNANSHIKPVSVANAKDVLRQNVCSSITPASKSNFVPTLGKGLTPGQNITFSVTAQNSTAPQHYAKMKAIQKIKQSGPLAKSNPNAVKSTPEPKKIQTALEQKEMTDDKASEDSKNLSWGRLGFIDLNSEKVQKYLNRKSSHAYEVEMAEMEKEAAYFSRMEKKEQMEEKMNATKEIVCDVVSCKQCRYTAHEAADRCKNEKHPLKCHKAIKRFYECKGCQRRAECFSRFPRDPCRNCGGYSFVRTGMRKIRSGPKLDYEVLNIRGDEIKFL